MANPTFIPPMGAGSLPELQRLLTPSVGPNTVGQVLAEHGYQFPSYIPPHMMFSDEPAQAAQIGQPATRGGFGYRHPGLATGIENALIGASIPTGVTTGENIANVIGGLRNIPLTRRQWQMMHLFAPLELTQQLEQGVLAPERTSQGTLARGTGIQLHGEAALEAEPSLAQRNIGLNDLNTARANAVNQATQIQAQQYNVDPLMYGVRNPLDLFTRSPQLAQDYFSAQALGRRAYQRPSNLDELLKLTSTPAGMARYQALFPARTGTAPATPNQRADLEKWRATQLQNLQKMIANDTTGTLNANAIYNTIQNAYQDAQSRFGGPSAQPSTNPLLSPAFNTPSTQAEDEDPLGFFNQ